MLFEYYWCFWWIFCRSKQIVLTPKWFLIIVFRFVLQFSAKSGEWILFSPKFCCFANYFLFPLCVSSHVFLFFLYILFFNVFYLFVFWFFFQFYCFDLQDLSWELKINIFTWFVTFHFIHFLLNRLSLQF